MITKNNFNPAILNRILCTELRPKIRNSDRVIRRKYLHTLPDEIRGKVENYISENPIVSRGCWYNSHLLSLSIEETDVVKGWYGVKIDKNIIDEFKRSHKCSERMVKLYENNEVVEIIDMNKGISYTRHSWNKYKDNHFCITTELNPEYKGVFVYLDEHEVVTGKSLNCNPSTKSEYYSICKSYVSEHYKYGSKVINQSLLDK